MTDEELFKKARELYSENKDVAKTAKVLKDDLGLSAEKTAKALYSDYGCNLDAEETARALYSEKTGICVSDLDITRILSKNFKEDAAGVFKALVNCCEMGFAQAAQALHSEHGGGFAIERIAEVMKKCSVPLEEIVIALRVCRFTDDGIEKTLLECGYAKAEVEKSLGAVFGVDRGEYNRNIYRINPESIERIERPNKPAKSKKGWW